MKLSQKGQSMIEFSVIFPFFMLLIMTLAYFGLAFADYLQLNNIARSSAREAVMSVNVDNDNEKTLKLNAIKQKYYEQGLLSQMYIWDANHGQFNIDYDEDKKNFTVTIEAPLNRAPDSLSGIIDRLANQKISESGALNIKIEYTMYKG